MTPSEYIQTNSSVSINREKITDRLHARTAAKLIIELVKEEASTLTKDGQLDAFYACLANAMPELKNFFPVENTQAQLSKMDDNESRVFGKHVIDFGMHAGEEIDEIEVDYLKYIASDPQRRFRAELKRYLLSDRVVNEVRGDEARS